MDASHLKRELAVFQTSYGGFIEASQWADETEGYTRVSEYQTVTFEPLPAIDVMGKQLAELDRQEKKIMAESQRMLTEIQRKRAELLAIPQEIESCKPL